VGAFILKAATVIGVVGLGALAAAVMSAQPSNIEAGKRYRLSADMTANFPLNGDMLVLVRQRIEAAGGNIVELQQTTDGARIEWEITAVKTVPRGELKDIVLELPQNKKVFVKLRSIREA
jgi:hypothetical protein